MVVMTNQVRTDFCYAAGMDAGTRQCMNLRVEADHDDGRSGSKTGGKKFS